jgi:regulator of protease activity HflC (stomatin/prohibitin superfamily)
VSALITVFIDKHAAARGTAALGTLYFYADAAQSTSVTLQFPHGMAMDDQVKAAESLLAGVQRWRDDVVRTAEERRTAVDELAEARAEIARLKAEAGDE